ncbi:MAG: YceI family protein [Saprospiraceae bacterium]|nr:YceI family protein [Saprospiraceae bacterium]
MKNLFFLSILAIAAFAFTTINDHTVDTAASNVVWTGEKVTGKHTGNVKIKNGNLKMQDGKLVGGSFEIDMTSIECTDLDAAMGGKLVGHLKSDDFFGVDGHPTSKFVITRAIPQDTKGNYKIVGDLTIKEKTNPVVFKANVGTSGGKVTATGSITVDRSLYDIRFGSGSFFDNLGDKTIYDEFYLQVSLVTK